MDKYITGTTIRSLREEKSMTQAELADKLCVSDKTVSKWEMCKGYPDITLLEPLAEVLGVSVTELLTGDLVNNSNVSSNMLRSKFYVCPVCGNVFYSVGEAQISCHGIVLPALEAEQEQPGHELVVENVEDEYYVYSEHDMTKQHYISFMAALSPDRVQIVKLYPEGSADTRFKRNACKKIYYYCNRDGLFVKKI